jgi:glycosyltransferase involved in cell wall biosynthesis
VLTLAGDGPDRAELAQLADALAPGRVRFRGWTAGRELVDLYATAECLVLPSASEGFPTVVGEALACGTPVVASRVGGVPELVADGDTGWLVPPGDDKALAERLRFALSHPDVLAAMRPRARKAAERRVSPPVIAAELRAAFAALRQNEAA